MRRLGRDGLEVSAIGLGCMGMADVYGPANEQDCVATLRRALDLDITLFDTAEVYGPFSNEELVARVLGQERKEARIATKVGYKLKPEVRGLGCIAGVDGSPAHLRVAALGFLRRLGGDAIDLMLLHRVDPAVPIGDSVGALADLVRAGHVRHIGLCEASPRTIRRAHAVHPLAAVQTECLLWSRSSAEAALGVCRELGIGFMAYSPLGRGS